MTARIETDEIGLISRADDAPRVLNFSARGAQGRNLLLFFPEDRRLLQSELARAVEGIPNDPVTVTLRPRDRRPVDVSVLMIVLDTSPPTVCWEIQPIPDTERVDDVRESIR